MAGGTHPTSKTWTILHIEKPIAVPIQLNWSGSEFGSDYWRYSGMIESISKIIFNAFFLLLILFAAFSVSPYTGFAALGVIVLFSIKK